MKSTVGLVAFFALTCLPLFGSTAAAQDLVNLSEMLPSPDAPLSVQQWIAPDTQGVIRGTVLVPGESGQPVPVSGADVVLTDASGASVSTAADAEGRFAFVGVMPGVYSFMARTDRSFSCMALHVMGRDSAFAAKFPTSIMIMSAAIGATQLQDMLTRYAPPTSAPQSHGISYDAMGKMVSQLAVGSQFQVAQVGGGMMGQIFGCGLSGDGFYGTKFGNVMLFQNGNLVDRVVTDNNGVFRVPSLATGMYSILAVGPDGCGAAAFELVGSSTISSRAVSSDGETFVNALVAPGAFNVQVVPASQLTFGRPDPEEEEIVGGPLSTGGFNGGTSGGGGGGPSGGGGGGGLGGLASLAGLGALAGLNGGNGGGGGNALFPPQPARPATP